MRGVERFLRDADCCGGSVIVAPNSCIIAGPLGATVVGVEEQHKLPHAQMPLPAAKWNSALPEPPSNCRRSGRGLPPKAAGAPRQTAIAAAKERADAGPAAAFSQSRDDDVHGVAFFRDRKLQRRVLDVRRPPSDQVRRRPF